MMESAQPAGGNSRRQLPAQRPQRLSCQSACTLVRLSFNREALRKLPASPLNFES